jgi:DNA invertase Pin-like site-specific DNA recombinase
VEGRLAYARQQGWPLRPDQLSRDDGCSGARLDRPALDRLRDAVASGGEVETVLVTSPDRLVAEGSRACRVTVLSKQHVDDLDALVAQLAERVRLRTATPTATNSGSAAPHCDLPARRTPVCGRS